MPNHLDADTLAAFFEDALTAFEKSSVFAHLSACPRCRDWFAFYCTSAAKPICRQPSSLPAVQIACGLLAAALVAVVTLPFLSVKEKTKATPLTSWIFIRDFSPSSPQQPSLPAALSAVRWGTQPSFPPLTTDKHSKPDQPLKESRFYSRIFLKTNVGVRSISLSLFREYKPDL
jgi:hypothetical protein